MGTGSAGARLERVGEAVAHEVDADEHQTRAPPGRPHPPAEPELVEAADAALRRIGDQVAEGRADERGHAEAEILGGRLDQRDLADQRGRRRR